MSKIKAILIDPMDKVIRNVEVEANLKGYYSMLNCEMIEFAYMEDCPFDVALIVDEEGTFHGTDRGLV